MKTKAGEEEAERVVRGGEGVGVEKGVVVVGSHPILFVVMYVCVCMCVCA
jgi:hypothetical protein